MCKKIQQNIFLNGPQNGPTIYQKKFARRRRRREENIKQMSLRGANFDRKVDDFIFETYRFYLGETQYFEESAFSFRRIVGQKT